jgi:hypothetical protein
MTAIESPTNAFIGTQPIATSYYGLGGDESLVQHVHIAWDATLVATITIWSSNFQDVALNSTDAKEWCQENPPTGYTAISPAGAATAATPLVLSIPGGTAGCASMHIGMLGSRLMRARVIATVAGFLRIKTNGKD